MRSDPVRGQALKLWGKKHVALASHDVMRVNFDTSSEFDVYLGEWDPVDLEALVNVGACACLSEHGTFVGHSDFDHVVYICPLNVATWW